MKYLNTKALGLMLALLFSMGLLAQKQGQTNAIPIPTETTKPWVFWHWIQAAISKEGITADLEAMKENGIGGAYLMPIKGPANPPIMNPPVVQLSPLFWEMVRHAMQEAKRLNLQLGMHFSDGFALGGGPWISPEISMQKLVWTLTSIKGNQLFKDSLQKPESYKSYYKDIAVLAFPTPSLFHQSSLGLQPKVSTSKGEEAGFLTQAGNTESYRSSEPGWIQYAFAAPFTCRSITIRTSGNNYQAQRLKILFSNDGKNFKLAERLQPPRHGWQDTDADYTSSIKPVTARYFRFVYDLDGTEPGSEDLDAAKWKPTLKLTGIELSGRPVINQYQAKNGQVWRIAPNTTAQQVPDILCVPQNKIIDITKFLGADGTLNWQVPAGEWTVLRMGHTSTGHTNATGGGAMGLECDKFTAATAELQFDKWFGEAMRQVGPSLTKDVLKTLLVESWECGSQNWSDGFRQAFQKKQGYDLMSYLPALAGIPVNNIQSSEQFLFDFRETIAQLVHDEFFGTIQRLAHEKGIVVATESVAPTMMSDGMLHYNKADIAMGEFWLNSPTHDKQNDMFDAISGAHIYGKNIVQAEAFTTVRMAWNEHPGMMKPLQDLNYAKGLNQIAYHVFAHNPWLDRKPGMTLDGVGLYFQRDQIWWKPGKAWVDYATRSQTLLQQGDPVVDIAVFTGEGLPRRSVLPDRLVPALPGLFGKERIAEEAIRLANKNQPTAEEPAGVFHSKNMALPHQWVDPMRGYKYDCVNPDALLRLAEVKDGRIVFPGGASYAVLVIPGVHPMQPNGNNLSLELLNKISQLVNAGANIIWVERPAQSPGMLTAKQITEWRNTLATLWPTKLPANTKSRKVGKGTLWLGPWQTSDLANIGLKPDFSFFNQQNIKSEPLAWTHRRDGEKDLYFISNPTTETISGQIKLRENGREPILYQAVTDKTEAPKIWQQNKFGTQLPIQLEAGQSVFVLLEKPTDKTEQSPALPSPKENLELPVNGPWKISFDAKLGGPSTPVITNQLFDWSTHADSSIYYYSGTANYETTFSFNGNLNQSNFLQLGSIANLAEVWVNGINCGVSWTAPFELDISKALRNGENQLRIAITNTWANRLMGDNRLPAEKRITQTTAPFRLQGKPLQKAGLFGPVQIQQQ